MRAYVASAGFATVQLGPKSSAGPPARLPLRAIDRAKEERDLRERFVRGAARQRVPLVTQILREVQPDVVVCDETDFGTMVGAECAGVPYASVQVIAAGSFLRPEVIGEALDEVRVEFGLSRDPGLDMLHRYLVLSPIPPSFRDPRFPPPPTLHPFRSGIESAAAIRPSLIYCTLGTIFNSESGDLLTTLVQGLRELGHNLLVTVGREIDIDELGEQPPHVRVEQFIPQSDVLPHCLLAVSHGGSGSVIGALAHGVPSVLVPLGADQPLNADRCADLGVARVLDPESVTPALASAAAREVLETARYRIAAQRLQGEIAELPGPGHAVALLEQLAAHRAPVQRRSQLGRE